MGLLKLIFSDRLKHLENAIQIKQNYPSVKVVGRGTIFIDPNDITNAEGFNAKVKSMGKVKLAKSS